MRLFYYALRNRIFHRNNPAISSPQFRFTFQQQRNFNMMNGHGDLNNSHAGRTTVEFAADPTLRNKSLAITHNQDDASVRDQYRPFLFDGNMLSDDWIAELELSTALKMVQSEILDKGLDRLRILVLYGSLRSRLVTGTTFP